MITVHSELFQLQLLCDIRPKRSSRLSFRKHHQSETSSFFLLSDLSKAKAKLRLSVKPSGRSVIG